MLVLLSKQIYVHRMLTTVAILTRIVVGIAIRRIIVTVLPLVSYYCNDIRFVEGQVVGQIGEGNLEGYFFQIIFPFILDTSWFCFGYLWVCSNGRNDVLASIKKKDRKNEEDLQKR